MATPQVGHAIAKCVSCDFEERRIFIQFGFKDRESFQVRLESNNSDVYLCYSTNEGKKHHSKTVAFDDFVELFRELVDKAR